MLEGSVLALSDVILTLTNQRFVTVAFHPIGIQIKDETSLLTLNTFEESVLALCHVIKGV